jgi:hypothetical protein
MHETGHATGNDDVDSNNGNYCHEPWRNHGTSPGQIHGGNASAPAPVTPVTPESSRDNLNLNEDYLLGNGTA